MKWDTHIFGVWALLAASILLSSCATGYHALQKEELALARESLTLNLESASHFAKLALKGIQREYPNKPSHVINDVTEIKSPSELHPAFYGSFDWHSSVHGHWMLVRLLKMFPALPEATQIRKVLGENLSSENMLMEAAYFQQANRKAFERMYGWAWLLKLAEELHKSNDPDCAQWFDNLQPLVDVIVKRYFDFLPKQTYPIRRGTHPNTAFGLAFALDYAREVEQRELEYLLVERSLIYFLRDKDVPAAWEPDGDDFFSRSLMEADLMRRVLSPDVFRQWFHRFLPDLAKGKPASLLEPAEVADRSDPKIVHLDGLNLSRAWCMNGIASALPENDSVNLALRTSAVRHARATLPYIASGNYEGEHWLASFAVYLLTNQ